MTLAKIISLLIALVVPLLAIGLSSDTALAYISHSGTISSNETWGTGTHYVIKDITIDDGVVLTISAGAVVKFAPSTGITVNGTLDVNGSFKSLPIFTSRDDDSYGETIPASDGSPDPGDWDGIMLDGSGPMTALGSLTTAWCDTAAILITGTLNFRSPLRGISPTVSVRTAAALECI